MAQKPEKTTKASAGAKKTAKRTTTKKRTPRIGDADLTSVLDGSMKEVIRSSFLKR